MSDRHLHIVSFTVPFPADYGGVIDVFYKLKALHAAGIRIHLHCFSYDREPAAELDAYCESVQYYARRTGMASQLSVQPYIVQSRKSGELLKNLLADDYPILFEGLHSCYLLGHKALRNRRQYYRESNIEHDYYYHLYRSENQMLRKTYFLAESLKLRFFQQKLRHATAMLVVSASDRKYLAECFPEQRVVYLPSFHGNQHLQALPGRGKYVLYHGNLSVSENEEAAEYLLTEVFSKISIPFRIAGKNPGSRLTKLVELNPHARLTANPSAEEMDRLIREAQVNLLVTFQPTGLKLKLLNTLYNGRWLLVNRNMLAGTGLEKLCETADTAADLREKLTSLFSHEFHPDQIRNREQILSTRFSDEVNARALIQEIFGA
jgi:hypothetical protein